MATAPRRRAADKTASTPAANAKPQGFDAAGSPLATVTLEMIVAATAADSFIYLSPESVLHFGASVLTNEAFKMNDYIAARSTQPATTESTNPVTQTQTLTAADVGTTSAAALTAAALTAVASSFEIVENFTMPTTKRPGNGNTKYPFDALSVGAAFFVPAGTVKSLASTVASANARYAEVVKHPDGSPVMRTNRKNKSVEQTKQIRMFQVRAGERNGVKGAYVGRIAVAA